MPERGRAERALLRRSFAHFVDRAWPLVTGTKLIRNVATDAMIATLQAVADGRLRRVCIAVAPGLGKSTLVSVLYPAWRWARDPSHRMITASHAHQLAVTMSLKARRLIEGDWYRDMFGVQLARDENRGDHFATTSGGHRISVGTAGALLGFRAHEAIADDPLDGVDARSKAARDAANTWFDESLSTRLDGEGSIIVVQQRLDRDDVIGHLIGLGGYELLSLPVEYDPRRQCVVRALDGSIVWQDPRKRDGELLAPITLTATKLSVLKRQLGSSAFASQFNQAPASDADATIKRAWWRFYKVPGVVAPRRPAGCTDDPAVDLPTSFDSIAIACDLTFGSKKGDYAVVQVWGARGGGRYLIEQWRKRAGFEAQVQAIKTIAAKYPHARIVVEKAANGAAVIETLAAQIPNVVPEVPKGSKMQRLASVAPTIESASCYLPDSGADWVGDFVEEMAGATKHDDAQDACVYALLSLALFTSEYEARRASLLNSCALACMGDWTRAHIERWFASAKFDYTFRDSDLTFWKTSL